ncbi:MAG: RagB/SusD family nutrient uptake outer membrane protein [Tannerellaceae bacterium]
MNNKIQSILKYTCLSAGVLLTTSCNDFLDREPLDQVTPGQFFTTEADLASYAVNMYSFTTHGGWGLGTVLRGDDNTDNQATTDASYSRWVPGEKRVPQSGGGWDFGRIRNANYFFEHVIPNWKSGKIQGAPKNIEQYIGEVYFLRAYEYFNKLKSYGDFPIVKNTLPDKPEELIAASKRSPRNEVARFILADLDSSIILMTNDPVGKKNRLTKNAALLFKSRVALFEATWLKYHQGTARVPGGPGWPGASKDYNQGFSIDIDSEINFFLTEAMEAAQEVADASPLTQNTGVVNPDGKFNSWNPYFDMFNANSMEDFKEVIFWKSYSATHNINHAVTTYILSGGGNSGLTKSMVDGFLMENGLPIYASNSGYAGEDSVELVKKDRDGRLQLFMIAPSDLRTIDKAAKIQTFGKPVLLEQPENRAVTGYCTRKCLSYDPAQPTTGVAQTYGCIVFRAAEAYLNYIEASYVKNGSLDAKATEYWKALRSRAGVSDDLNKTIAATDLSKEGDWAKYSGTSLVDPTLFNIRRERRNEFMSEGFRYDDLIRWRALDMVKNYQIEGFNLWESTYANQYVDDEGKSEFIEEGTSDKQGNISNRKNSKYVRPNQIIKVNNKVYDGYNWSTANYLEPIAIQHFLITASNPSDLTSSPIYQNPQWSLEANTPAID